MKNWKLYPLVAIAIIGCAIQAQAQERIEASIDADIVSHYWWRGIDKGHVSIQPEASLSWQGLKLSVDGNTGFDSDDAHEINLKLQYSKFGFNIGAIDYWTSGIDANNRYFYYNEKKGGHQFEGNIGYTCDYFSLQAYTVVWGGDYKINGDKAYSTFVELSIPFKLGGIDWDLRGGITPFESAGYQTEKPATDGWPAGGYQNNYYYADGFSCVMASLRATKSLDLGFTEIPLFAEFHSNPYMRRADLIFGITIKPL